MCQNKNKFYKIFWVKNSNFKQLNARKNMQRRDFLRNSALGLLAAGIGLEAFAEKRIKKYGCQLYSVRDMMTKDPKNTMAELAKMGYSYFESYSADPFWGMAPKDAQKFLGDNDAKMISTHAGLDVTSDAFFAKAAEGGLKYVLNPYIGPQKDRDAWLEKADKFNKLGELAKKHGIQFGYHNHSYSFVTNNGLIGQKLLLENTDPNLVVFELDMCWSEAAGTDTIDHLDKYGNRYKLCHIKQLKSKTGQVQQTDLSLGVIDYKSIIAKAKSKGMECFLVEQEQYASSSMESMKLNAAFMDKFTF
jgi:sugar phosphate isomerase/epimerase